MVPLYNSGRQEIIDKLQTNFDTSVVTKIAAKAVNVQLRRYAREHNLLSPVQSFFFAHHSKLTAVTYFCDSVRLAMDSLDT